MRSGKSHLLYTIKISSRSGVGGCSVSEHERSIIQTIKSASSNKCNDRSIPCRSKSQDVFRKPAVSQNNTGKPSIAVSTETTSRVVPGA